MRLTTLAAAAPLVAAATLAAAATVLTGCLSMPSCELPRAPEPDPATDVTAGAAARAAAGPRATESSQAPERASDLAAHDLRLRAAISRSLPFLEQEGVAWMRGELPVQGGRGCVSCHHVGFAVWSHGEARRIGLEVEGSSISELAATAIEFAARPDKGRSMSISPLLLGLDDGSEALHQRLLALQTSSGRWRARGQFPDQRRPEAESDAAATMYSLLALPDRSLDSAAAAAALGWLQSAPDGETTEWLATSLLVATRREHAGDAERARRQLLGTQNADGGWGWSAGEASNAFSTGQALYALSRSGRGDADAAADAERYLLASQQDDGTWAVPSAAISRQPDAARDVIYRFWGTAWATLGLARSAYEAGQGVGGPGLAG